MKNILEFIIFIMVIWCVGITMIFVTNYLLDEKHWHCTKAEEGKLENCLQYTKQENL